MRSWTVRSAVAADLDDICQMLDLFTVGHPSAKHVRPREVLRDAFFGVEPLVKLVVAEQGPRIVGMAGWRPMFDSFWAMRGGSADGLFVRPEARGIGIAVALLAQVCADVRAWGGVFLHGTYGDQVAQFYERVVESWPARETYLSESAFQRLADLAGAPARELVRRLPDRALNRVPVKRD